MARDRFRRRATLGRISLAVVVALALALVVTALPASFVAPQWSLAQDDDDATPATPADEASPVATPGTPTPVTAEDQVFISGPWRLTVVSARFGDAIPEVELNARAGRDWALAIVDVTNWSDDSDEVRPRAFGLRVAGEEDGGGLAIQTTEEVAAQLGLQPADMDEEWTIEPEETERLALVFQIDDHGRKPALTFEESALPLAISLANSASPLDLPPLTEAPSLTDADVERLPNGGAIAIDDEVLQLTGVDSPESDECFAEQSTNQLIRLADRDVLLERVAIGDDEAIYAWTRQSDGSHLLLNRELVAGGFAGAEPARDPRFGAWLAEADWTARYGLEGLWAACTGPHGVDWPEDGFDRHSIEIDVDGESGDYDVWIAWPSTIIATPDGGAWVFFSAAARPPDGDGDRRLYASRYDPTTGEWSRAEPLPGGEVQFGAAAAVDAEGRVHLVYSDRRADVEDEYSVLRYTVENGAGGWTRPVSVAPDEDAGHQISPTLTIDPEGALHVLWQDQREWTDAERLASAVNADIFASQLAPGGEWAEPEIVNVHTAGEAGSRPHIVADGDRLVAVWSIYSTSFGLDAAARIEWTTRSLTDPEAEWAEPATLLAGRGEAFGGRLLHLRADPTGGVVFAYGRRNIDTFLFIRRLEAGAETWSGDILITFGSRGTFPTLAINEAGTVYIAYNLGEGALVDVGATAIGHGSISPGSEFNLTEDEPETQGRPVMTIDQTGAPWLIYFNESSSGEANAVRTLRGVLVRPGED